VFRIPDGKSFLPEQVIPRLLEAVDYLNLMTYDFGGNDAEGVAPLPWIVGNVQLFLMSNPEHASKILIGLNYYGRCTGSISDSIMFNKFLELLADDSYELLWDDTTRESYIQS
jgi:GH18 family chitinase